MKRMEVSVDAAARRCEIRIGCAERYVYASSAEYRETIRRYRAMGYRVRVFFDESAALLRTEEPGLRF